MIVGLVLGLFGLTSCRQIIETLTTQDAVVAVLLATPDMQHPLTGANVAGATTLIVYYGEVDATETDNETNGYTGLVGATVTLRYTEPDGTAREFPVADMGDGSYQVDTYVAPLLAYHETTYRLTVKYGGRTYVLETAAPPATDIAEVAAEPDRVIAGQAGSSLRITRSDARGLDGNDVAFASLASLSATTATVTWTNAPDDAIGFLDLLLRDDAWRADAFTVPGNALRTGPWAVSLCPMRRGGQVALGGEQLFFASSFFVGIAASGGLVVP